MTRGNAIWRLPLMQDGSVSKVGVFIQLSGGLSGPDGMALDTDGGLWIAHAGNACVWGFSERGAPLSRVVSRTGLTTTNIAFGGGDVRMLHITGSDTGNILRARTTQSGVAMFALS
jgi:gluconolactonase